MLGPTFAALLASTFSAPRLYIEGDSQYVIGAINKLYMVNDLFLFNCTELIKDLLGNSRHFLACWIPRDQNSVCDRLARQAVETKEISCHIAS